MTPALRVVAPGLATTVQDLGRPGYQHLGIPPSGALDQVSLQAANALVENPAGTGCLEIAYMGPTLAVEADSVRVALVGGKSGIEILSPEGDSVMRRHGAQETVMLERGQNFRVGMLGTCAVGYLAVEGGFAIAPVMGSQSTLTRAGIGGIEGRALRARDRIPLRKSAARERAEVILPPLDVAPPSRIRVVLGPQDDYFTEAGLRTLLQDTYTVTPATDRMGMRLSGPALEHSSKGYNIVSDAIATGSIQVPGNGLPIILLADRQTTGGYPKIAAVISADLPTLGRMTPGSIIAFEAVTVADAEEAARQLAARIAVFANEVVPLRRDRIVDEAKLLRENLVSGMVDAREGASGY
jgi:biotin-dependent carboxylase-like uncharacterized protein